MTAGPAGSGRHRRRPDQIGQRPTRRSPRTVPVYARPPATTQASAETATAMAVIRAIAPLRWCQISATVVLSLVRTRPAAGAEHREHPQAPRAGGRGDGEHEQTEAAPEVPAKEAACDVVDRLRLGLRAGQRVEHLCGGGVALHGAHGQPGTQRALDPSRGHVELGVADLHELRGTGPRGGGCAGTDGEVLAEGHDILCRRQRNGHRHADEQAERHEQHRRPGPQLAQHPGTARGDRLRRGRLGRRLAQRSPPSACTLDRFSVPGRGRPVTHPTP